jgi:hypothetical protein
LRLLFPFADASLCSKGPVDAAVLLGEYIAPTTPMAAA